MCFVVAYNAENVLWTAGLEIQMTTCRHLIVLSFFVRINVQFFYRDLFTNRDLFVTKQNIY